MVGNRFKAAVGCADRGKRRAPLVRKHFDSDPSGQNKDMILVEWNCGSGPAREGGRCRVEAGKTYRESRKLVEKALGGLLHRSPKIGSVLMRDRRESAAEMIAGQRDAAGSRTLPCHPKMTECSVPELMNCRLNDRSSAKRMDRPELGSTKVHQQIARQACATALRFERDRFVGRSAAGQFATSHDLSGIRRWPPTRHGNLTPPPATRAGTDAPSAARSSRTTPAPTSALRPC